MNIILVMNRLPSETRAQVIRALRALRTKREVQPPKKHGNIPL